MQFDQLSLFISQGTLKIIYYDSFHSIMNCGIKVLGDSPYNVEVFEIQNNIIRIITGCRNKYSCRDLFHTLKMLPIS